MKMKWIAGVLFLVTCGVIVGICATFTDVNSAQYWGKTAMPSLTSVIDANNALIEAGTITQNQLLLENGEIVDNGTDADITITFDDDATTLGQVIIGSSINATNLADNDVIEIIGRADDSASNDTDYATIQLKATDVTSATEDGQILLQGQTAGSEATFLTIGSSAGAVLAASFLTGMEVSVDGKWAVVGPDATTGLMVQSGSKTGDAGTTDTNTFTTAFGAAPIVMLEYTEAPGADTAKYIVSTATTQFVAEVVASKNYAWIAIGERP